MTESDPRAALKVSLIGAIFLGPILLAGLLYYVLPVGAPSARTNKGILLTPARPLPADTLEGVAGKIPAKAVFQDRHWTLLTVAPNGCGKTCKARLADTRQVRALLHDRAARVQRVLISGKAQDVRLIKQGHPDLKVYSDGGALAAFFAKPGERAVGPGVIYLIDPIGNWVLYYPANMRPDPLFHDLMHLLKYSHIG